MINVIWWEGQRGYWDHGLFMNVFDKYPDLFPQHNSKELIYPDRAIVIVPGKPEVTPLRAYLDKLKSGLVILTSEEDAYFNWQGAIPPHLEIWTQYYAPSKEEIKTRLLLGAPTRIKDYKINLDLPKKYLWSFVGQVQNPSRQVCVEVLKGLPDGFLLIADAFGGVGGLNYQDYLDIMCESKFVICPAGSMCVDSFRFYEAIECGAVPITEKRAPRDSHTFNYWKETGTLDKFIQVDNWGQISKLTDVNFESMNILVADWWADYKQELEKKLLSYATN